MSTPAFLSICSICGRNASFNEDFMDVICPKCAEYTGKDIAENVRKFRPKEATVWTILQQVCEFAKIPEHKIHTKTNKREIVEVRQIAMYMAKRDTKETLESIGISIGNKSHASVIHACRTVKNLFETDRMYREKYTPLLCPL